jgi:hypothetical protein
MERKLEVDEKKPDWDRRVNAPARHPDQSSN